MGIQAWFIILGVGAMMMIVWDGKRCKVKPHVSSVPEGLYQTPVATAFIIPDVSLKEMSPPKAVAANEMEPAVANVSEGSRIGAATHISGRVIADEPVVIRGHLEGSVIAPNHPVSVAASGHVASYIEGSYVDIDGQLVGTLKANTRATLLSRARVQGVVEAPRLECMAGAWLQADVAQKASLYRPKIALVS